MQKGQVSGLVRSLDGTIHGLTKIGSRAPGSENEARAARFIQQAFAARALDAEIQSFKAASHRACGSKVVLDDVTIDSQPVMFARGGDVEGKIIWVGETSGPLPRQTDLSEMVGLITPTGSHNQKIAFLCELERRGMKAVIATSPHMDSIVTKDIRYPQVKHMPIVAVTWRGAEMLARHVGQIVRVTVKTENADAEDKSRNVVAKVQGSSSRWMCVSAHFDTAPGTLGVLDNGGGLAAMLELAGIMAKSSPLASIYFVASGSEENGGTTGIGAGAEAFFAGMESQLDNCICHVEIDHIGPRIGCAKAMSDGPRAFLESIKRLLGDAYAVEVDKSIEFSCDHGAAVRRGVPYAWITDRSSHRPYYHTPDDSDVSLIDLHKVAAHVEKLSPVIADLAGCDVFVPYIRTGTFIIRPAYEMDIPSIRDVTMRAFGPVSTARMEEEFFGEKLGGESWFMHKNRGLEAHIRSNIYDAIVCEMGGKVVGFATARYDDHRGIAEICDNAVDPDFQGRGIGKALQAEIARRMTDAGFVRRKVQTLATDLPAIRIYEKLGYQLYTQTNQYLKKM